MCRTKQVLLLSKDCELKASIEKILENGINVLTTLYTMSDVVESTAVYGYDMMILDDSTFPINEDILSLFKKKTYYIPQIIVLSKEGKKKYSSFAKYCDFKNLDVVTNCLEELQAKKESPYPFNSSFLRDSIASILAQSELNPKYKGFKYLTEIIYRIINLDNVSKSFQKAVYPFIGRLFNVSPESVERDVRNIINVSLKNPQFLEKINFNMNYHPTTRNVVNHLVMHVKASI